MGYNHPEILKSNPYYDDFDDTKKFLRILFKPGYAVQARELTQLQTLLQNQISKFGSHIFKDGSQVFGGGISLSGAEFIRVQIGGNPSVNNLIGRIITQGEEASAKIIDAIAPISTDPYYILVIQYLSGTKFTTGTIADFNYNINYPNVTNASGNCQTLSVNSGIFYIDGFFCK